MRSVRPLRVRTLVCLLSTALLANAAFAQPKILFIGDSITVGTGTSDPSEEGFVAQIEQRFPELLVANSGCGGSTIRDWTTHWTLKICVFGNAWSLLAAPELPAQITHVMLGTNDALGYIENLGWVSPPEYESRLRMFVDRAPGLVLISSPPKNPKHPSDAVDDRLRGYREAIDVVVAEYAYVEHGVDSYSLLDPDSDFAGIHPNDRGHTRIADELERRILMRLPSGFLSPCKNTQSCERSSFLPQYRHPKPGNGEPRR